MKFHVDWAWLDLLVGRSCRLNKLSKIIRANSAKIKASIVEKSGVKVVIYAAVNDADSSADPAAVRR